LTFVFVTRTQAHPHRSHSTNDGSRHGTLHEETCGAHRSDGRVEDDAGFLWFFIFVFVSGPLLGTAAMMTVGASRVTG
jgi:hypothetical protein